MKALLFIPLFLSLLLVPQAFGQLTNDSIVVTTDKSSYSVGETIHITGEVRDLYFETPVSVIVRSPNDSNNDGENDLISIAQVYPDTNKKFRNEITAGGALMKTNGSYIITVQYGTVSRSATTTFEYDAINELEDRPTAEELERTSEQKMKDRLESGCGAGTIYDPDTNSCILTDKPSDESNSKCGAGTVFDEASNSCILIPFTPIQELELTEKDLQKFEKKIKKWNAIIENFERNADKFESKGNIERADYLRFKVTIYESMIDHLENLIY